ncbi:hypothetical protein BDZ89DRAFT_1060510 [Hymenopellis radicata]|nr:hypothetical protein BDZ89DRAFT_1060510 [Hymenopellis radicata]
MSNRRRIGVSAATTEAARRQLMQPVPCWEKVWVTPENSSVNSTLKVFKWVKTDKIQQFNDEENEADEPLAPLPDADDVEVIDADDDDEKDENVVTNVAPTPAEPDTALPETQEVEESQTQEEQPIQLTLQSTETDLTADLTMDDATGVLDDALKPMDVNMDVEDSGLKINEDGGMELDMSGFGPDGLDLEGGDLSQLEQDDAIMGGAMMDDTVDPFSAPLDS